MLHWIISRVADKFQASVAKMLQILMLNQANFAAKISDWSSCSCSWIELAGEVPAIEQMCQIGQYLLVLSYLCTEKCAKTAIVGHYSLFISFIVYGFN